MVRVAGAGWAQPHYTRVRFQSADAMSNPFQNAVFLTSAAKPVGLPPADRPEIGFAGRSNAGKSSALNALTGQKQLARVSKTPGRTQLLNFFDCPQVRMVDLPGYGFAKVPEKVRKSWGAMVGNFLQKRDNLIGVVLVMDVRHPLTEFDQQMLAWTIEYHRRCHILLTKADKFSYGKAKAQMLAVKRAIGEQPGVSLQLFSSLKRTGVDEARSTLAGWIAEELASPPVGDVDPEVSGD